MIHLMSPASAAAAALAGTLATAADVAKGLSAPEPAKQEGTK